MGTPLIKLDQLTLIYVVSALLFAVAFMRLYNVLTINFRANVPWRINIGSIAQFPAMFGTFWWMCDHAKGDATWGDFLLLGFHFINFACSIISAREWKATMEKR